MVECAEMIHQLIATPRQAPDQTVFQSVRIAQREFFDNIINANNFSHHSS